MTSAQESLALMAVDNGVPSLGVSLGKYHSSSIGAQVENGNLDGSQSEEKTIAQISQIENSAARVVCELKNGHTDQASNPSLINNVLGVVATLGKVEDDNLSSAYFGFYAVRILKIDVSVPLSSSVIFSEYLGLDHMLAIVCKSNEGIKHHEPCDQKGKINKSSGLQ
ncbi:hypothetical protein Syun_019707 [Stephania yunnanensis]|uniref:Uncharacterized protein n=1 Tax=Stephania yunnanensis TaxID=152371 RepID=A0AAP0IVB6_9MAGN